MFMDSIHLPLLILHDSVSFTPLLWDFLLWCAASSVPTQLIWGHICYSLKTTGLHLSSAAIEKTSPCVLPISSAHFYLLWVLDFCSWHSNCGCHPGVRCLARPWGLIDTTYRAPIWLCVLEQEDGGEGRERWDKMGGDVVCHGSIVRP